VLLATPSVIFTPTASKHTGFHIGFISDSAILNTAIESYASTLPMFLNNHKKLQP